MRQSQRPKSPLTPASGKSLVEVTTESRRSHCGEKGAPLTRKKGAKKIIQKRVSEKESNGFSRTRCRQKQDYRYSYKYTGLEGYTGEKNSERSQLARLKLFPAVETHPGAVGAPADRIDLHGGGERVGWELILGVDRRRMVVALLLLLDVFRRACEVVHKHLAVVAAGKQHVLLRVPGDRVHRGRVAFEGVERHTDVAQI